MAVYCPAYAGTKNHFSDATSRNPVDYVEDDQKDDWMETELVTVAAETLRSITWEIIRREGSTDQQIQDLITCIIIKRGAVTRSCRLLEASRRTLHH